MAPAQVLMDIYAALRAAFGHRNWWPGESPWEVMVGAVLTQRTNWRNVEQAISALRKEGVLEAHALARLPAARLQSLIRPAGYYRQKASRLLLLARWFLRRAGGSIDALQRAPTDELREELLSLRGIGPETADSILLYALGRPTFVVDAYTKRVLVRHGMMPEDCTYEELKEFFEADLPRDVELYKDYHAQLVELGKRFCRTKPICSACPLRPLLGEPLREYV